MGITVRANTYRHYGEPVTGNPKIYIYLDDKPWWNTTFGAMYPEPAGDDEEDELEYREIAEEARKNGAAFPQYSFVIEDDESVSECFLIRLEKNKAYYRRRAGRS